MGKLTLAATLAACAAFEIASAEAAVLVVSKSIQARGERGQPRRHHIRPTRSPPAQPSL